MSRKGNGWDNAVAESFFATLKTELVHLADWKTRAEAKSEIFEFMEVFYNGERLHSHLGYLSPMEYELSSKTFRRRHRKTVHETETDQSVLRGGRADPRC